MRNLRAPEGCHAVTIEGVEYPVNEGILVIPEELAHHLTSPPFNFKDAAEAEAAPPPAPRRPAGRPRRVFNDR